MADKFIAFNAYGDKQKYVDNGGEDSFSQAVAVEKSALPTGAATSAKQDTIIGHIDGVEGSLTTLTGKDFATQTTLSSILTKLADPATQTTLVQAKVVLDALSTVAGAKADTAVTDVSLSASEIALLKGILKQIQGNGTGSMPVKLSGSNMELYGATITARPAAAAVAVGATFTIVDSTGSFESWVSDGTNWMEV